MRINTTLLLLFFLLPIGLFGQSSDASLEQGAKYFKEKNYTAAYAEYEKAYLFYKENGKPKEMLEALFQMGKSNTHTAKWEESLAVFANLEEEAKEAGQLQMVGKSLDAQIQILHYFMRHEETEAKANDLLAIKGLEENLYSDAYTALGQVYGANGQLQLAYQTLMKAYAIDSLRQDSTSMPFLIASIAANQELQGKYNKAIQLYLQAIATVPKKDSFKFTTFYSRLGGLFLDIGNLEKARAYMTEAMELCKRFNHKSTFAKCEYYMGHICNDENNDIAAKEYYQSALDQFISLNNPEFEFYATNGLASIALKNNELTTAATLLKKAEKLLDNLTGKQFKKSHINNNIEYYLKNGELTKAKKYLDEAINSMAGFQKIGYQVRTFRLAEEYYLQQRDYKNAYLFKGKYQLLKDSIFQIQKASLLYEMEAQYQKAQQDLSISELNIANNEKVALLDRQNRTIIFGGLGLLALGALGVMGLYLYHVKRKTAEELLEKNDIISKALKDKELLLREIHHRVKNNLQVISSLLRLQSKYIKDDNALSAINEGRNRVQSMALIHQNLYQKEDLVGIQIKEYFEQLIQSLFDSYKISESRIILDMDIDPLTLDVDTVVPLGLIVNELVSNTFKHAFPQNRVGKLSVSLKETTDQQLLLTVSDNGVGINEVAKATNKDSFGYKMIRAFQAKLEADLDVRSENGTTVSIGMKDYKKVG